MLNSEVINKHGAGRWCTLREILIKGWDDWTEISHRDTLCDTF